MNKLPLDTLLTLIRQEKLLGHGSDLDEITQLFAKNVKSMVSTKDVEYCLALYLSKSKHNDAVHRNAVIRQLTQFMNRHGWNLSDYHLDYYREYLYLFR